MSCSSSPLIVILFLTSISFTLAQDYDDDSSSTPAMPPEEENCNGAFLTYTFISRTKEFPHLKNASAQAYAFKAMATVTNTMDHDLKQWKLFVGFQNNEILVSTDGAVVADGTDFPVNVENGTNFVGFPQSDLQNSIDTAGDLTKIKVEINMVGTQFGVKPPSVPMPKTIKLVNDGINCPTPKHKGNLMYVCCIQDPKWKIKRSHIKFLPRQHGDLTISYDILQAYPTNYLAQVTMENHHPLSRLDNWNLTWEWMRGEFIYSTRGAYTLIKDSTDCIYGQASNYYQNIDFSKVLSCQKRPILIDLPAEREKDNELGNIPYCCKNGALLPPTMDPSLSKAVFQLQVYKMPPDMNRTALYPPHKWEISGVLNPHYVCGAPIRVSPAEFPDPSGLTSESIALASWQVVCNMTRPKARAAKCCVSYSAYYNDSVIPCSTCACGCPEDATCDTNAVAMLLPPEALLVPFENRTIKARAWAHIKHWPLPRRVSCGDNCGVSINWHLFSDYKNGWTARITIFNWEDYTFRNWFLAIQMKKNIVSGYENVYSFNGTKLNNTVWPDLGDTIFMQGLPGLNYLMPEVDGKTLSDPRVPGKQQSVISFKKKLTPGINIRAGDGFPDKVFFNGEECTLPEILPTARGYRASSPVIVLNLVLSVAVVILLMNVLMI
ncbi:COBRA-like protein 10 [Dendrobium catenatum]|uniref:COBRA-like protein 10 n=1 Tax=Dendrobium catenatum TaxID=906689 RepID=A0A2I0VVP6_9ASPA|nr:COBRA-like protein 10 [Dendrobium catenatum]PKU67479.1 COBRA-like protein 10 [Dendrobium catenatum]